jgi:glutaryl-CoA dehydrogenase
MTVTLDERLGAALATDYFLLRDQFDDADWEHFLRTRRFVDEEVLPVINDYWERAEPPWPLMHRLAELASSARTSTATAAPA